jgi:F0F1-type ATP synthase assembly protein I
LSPEAADERPDQGDKETGLAAGLAFAVMGTTAATCVAVGIGLGLWCDAQLGSSPFGLLAGILLGSVAAVVSVIQQIQRFL